jgi:hypothetical protein
MQVSCGRARAPTKCVPRWSRGGLRTVLTASRRGDFRASRVASSCDNFLTAEVPISSTRVMDTLIRWSVSSEEYPRRHDAGTCRGRRRAGQRLGCDVWPRRSKWRLPSGTSEDSVCVALRRGEVLARIELAAISDTVGKMWRHGSSRRQLADETDPAPPHSPSWNQSSRAGSVFSERFSAACRDARIRLLTCGFDAPAVPAVS